ncbi:hypothetical protein R6Q59_014915 [Mikania micrantha]
MRRWQIFNRQEMSGWADQIVVNKDTRPTTREVDKPTEAQYEARRSTRSKRPPARYRNEAFISSTGLLANF